MRLKQFAKRSYLRCLKALGTSSRADGPKQSEILWLDLGDLGDLVYPLRAHEQWQDHGLGLLRTILHHNGVVTESGLDARLQSLGAAAARAARLRHAAHERAQLHLPGRALKAAQIFKEVNPDGPRADRRHARHGGARRDGERRRVRQDLPGAGRERHRRPGEGPAGLPARCSRASGAKSMAEWPMIDRTLWPQPRELAAAAPLSHGRWSPSAAGARRRWPPC